MGVGRISMTALAQVHRHGILKRNHRSLIALIDFVIYSEEGDGMYFSRMPPRDEVHTEARRRSTRASLFSDLQTPYISRPYLRRRLGKDLPGNHIPSLNLHRASLTSFRQLCAHVPTD